MIIKVKEYQEKLVRGVRKVLESKEFKEFLSFSARFRRYSFNNTLLIWCQRPRATRVAGMKAWNFMGRYVKKGEKGVAIFAPLLKKVAGLYRPGHPRKPILYLQGQVRGDLHPGSARCHRLGRAFREVQ